MKTLIFPENKMFKYHYLFTDTNGNKINLNAIDFYKSDSFILSPDQINVKMFLRNDDEHNDIVLRPTNWPEMFKNIHELEIIIDSANIDINSVLIDFSKIKNKVIIDKLIITSNYKLNSFQFLLDDIKLQKIENGKLILNKNVYPNIVIKDLIFNVKEANYFNFLAINGYYFENIEINNGNNDSYSNFVIYNAKNLKNVSIESFGLPLKDNFSQKQRLHNNVDIEDLRNGLYIDNPNAIIKIKNMFRLKKDENLWAEARTKANALASTFQKDFDDLFERVKIGVCAKELIEKIINGLNFYRTEILDLDNRIDWDNF